METLRNILLTLAGVITLAVLLGWLGLAIKPGPYPAYTQTPPPAPDTIPLPSGLPQPVERFYRLTYGERIPVIHSAVLSGRGSMAPFGISMPMRYRFMYNIVSDGADTSHMDYLSHIDTTLFTLPVMKVDENYVAGRGIGKMPYGIDQGAWFDQSINLRAWCEILTWLPAALLTTPGVRWDPIDEATAILTVPYTPAGAPGSPATPTQQRVIVRFDPETGKVEYFEVMKHRDAKTRALWINATWLDQGAKRWVFLNNEESLINVDVQPAMDEYLTRVAPW